VEEGEHVAFNFDSTVQSNIKPVISQNLVGNREVDVNIDILNQHLLEKLNRDTFVTGPPLSTGINVILSGFYRSGMKFYSEIFSKNKEFMFFEDPLINLKKDSAHIEPSEALSIMESTFSCKFWQQPDIMTLPHAKLSSLFCGGNDTDTSIDECLPKAQKKAGEHISSWVAWVKDQASRCVKATNHASTVRRLTSVESMVPLLRKGVKVIQLVRDPRSLTLSRMDKPGPFLLNKNDVVLGAEARSYCQGVMKNVATIQELNRQYPGQLGSLFYIGRYEDLVDAPEDSIHDIYSFLKGKADGAVQKWFEDRWDRTLHHYQPQPSDHWRPELIWAKGRKVQDNCAHFMDLFGYKSFEEEHDYLNKQHAPVDSNFSPIDIINGDPIS